MKIEIIPGLTNRSIKSNFEQLLTNCLNVKGCVAFWTLGVEYFKSEALLKAIKKSGSFYCIDIQSPTNIDKIAEYVTQHATEIYLHKYRLDPNQYNLNTNLLHSKVVMFELQNNQVEIWVGSHNLTNFALSGFNIEASTHITCTKSDEIYTEILTYLEEVKNNYCDKFDLDKVDIYKKLQTRNAEKQIVISGGSASLENVVTLVGKDMENLQAENIIQLLSLNSVELSKFKTVEKIILLHTFDIETKKENLYVSNIAQAGKIDPRNPKLDIDFTIERRFAYIGTGKLAYLKDSMKIDKQILRPAKYFANITIREKVKSFEIFEKPSLSELSLWQYDKESPYSKRVNDKTINRFIQIATYEETLEPRLINIAQDWDRYEAYYMLFYEYLDTLISQGYTKASKNEKFNELYQDIYDLILRQQWQEQQAMAEMANIELNDILDFFLKKYFKNIDLSQYYKSQVERIILGIEDVIRWYKQN